MAKAQMTLADLCSLFLHFLTLSLLSIGGAISTVPEMHRFLVEKNGWLTDTGFTASIALAQAAPGPNVLFVAVLGWNVAGGDGGHHAALFGLIIATGWLLAAPFVRDEAHRWGALALVAITVVLTLKTRLGLVWMVLAGGVAGALGLV
jgi:chromate transporter